MENTTQFTLQLRFVGKPSEGLSGGRELEVLALPTNAGQPFHGRFQQWEPVFEDICGLMSSSPFHRKAIQRTLAAGLDAHMINRETGDKHIFSSDELAALSLKPVNGMLPSDLSNAA